MAEFLPGSLEFFPALLLVFASFFTSALTATAGVGGGLLMLAFMTYAIPIVALIPVHGLVQLGSNSSRAFIQRDYIDWPITRQFFLGAVIAGIVGVFVIVQVPESALQIFLGLFMLLMVWVKLPKLKKVSPPLVVAGGAITTFTSFFAGATGPLVAVFLNNLFDEHKKLVATHGVTMVIKHTFKLIVFAIAGFAFLEWIPFVIAMVISGYAGTKMGTHLLDKLPESTLKMIFKITLTICAIDLLRRGFL